MQNLATLFRDSKQLEKAVDLFDKLIEIVRSKGVEVKPNVLGNIYNSAAGCYRGLKQFKESDELLKSALKIMKDNFGERNLPSATIYNNMGMSFKDQGRNVEALEYYNKALEIRKEFLPEDHPEVIAIKHNIGQLHYDKGDKDNAMKYFDENVKTLEKNEQPLTGSSNSRI